MERATLKTELIDKIEHADLKQLKEIYGLIINYLNSNSDITEEWDLLPEYQKQQILKGLEEADAGLGTPAKGVIQRAREKYGLNG
jgi:hypothetical protein